jgi:hypothetical protein
MQSHLHSCILPSWWYNQIVWFLNFKYFMDLKSNSSEKFKNESLGSKNLTLGVDIHPIQINCLPNKSDLRDFKNEVLSSYTLFLVEKQLPTYWDAVDVSDRYWMPLSSSLIIPSMLQVMESNSIVGVIFAIT